jgi:hypothetical protein
VIKGFSRIYGRVEASIDSLELADQDEGSRFLLIMVGRRGREGLQGIMTGRVFRKDFDVGSLSKTLGLLSFPSDNTEGLATSKVVVHPQN